MKHVAKCTLLVFLALTLVLAAVGCASEPPPPTAAPAAPTAPPSAPTTAPAAPIAATASPTSAADTPTPPTAAPAAALPNSITFAGPSAGSADYSTIVALAKVGGDTSPIRVIAQAFAGPAAWVPSMSSTGKPELGIINASEAWQAYTGKAAAGPLPEGVEFEIPYKQAHPNLRMLIMGAEMTTGFVVKKDSSYQSVADLKGTSTTWGYKAQIGGLLSHVANLVAAGVSKSDLKTVDVAAVVDAMRALGEGRVDSTSCATTASIVAEIDANTPLRYIDVPNDPEGIKRAQVIMPGCRVATVQGGSAAAVLKDTDVIGFTKAVITGKSLSDDAAYALVKAWFENFEQILPLDPKFGTMSPEQFVSNNATIPYHPGAIRFYKEKGLWTAEMEKNQEILLRGHLPMLQ